MRISEKPLVLIYKKTLTAGKFFFKYFYVMEISVSLKTEHMLTDLHVSNTIKVTCMLALTICSLKTENKAWHNPFTS